MLPSLAVLRSEAPCRFIQGKLFEGTWFAVIEEYRVCAYTCVLSHMVNTDVKIADALYVYVLDEQKKEYGLVLPYGDKKHDALVRSIAILIEAAMREHA